MIILNEEYIKKCIKESAKELIEFAKKEDFECVKCVSRTIYELTQKLEEIKEGK